MNRRRHDQESLNQRVRTAKQGALRSSIRIGRYMRHAASLLIVLSVVVACATLRVPAGSAVSETQRPAERPATDERLNATLWHQTSAEYRLLTQMIYSIAKLQLERALADPQWTAEPSQKEGFQDLPPAVIMDIDETVLDTSVFQGRLVKDRLEYSGDVWKIWLKKQEATGVPGAVDFISFAQARGVTVFFVTNRDYPDEEETRTSLTSIGIRLPENIDPVLSRGERADWGSDKATRRRFIARSYRVLLLVGDDLGDFISEYRGTPQDRVKEALKHSEWGTRWILLPNPIYGSWEGSLYNFNTQLGKEGILQRKFEQLR